MIEPLTAHLPLISQSITRQVEATDGTFVFDGVTSLIDIRDRYDIDLLASADGVETVGGYVFSQLGRPARVGDLTSDPG